jgi:tripartite ATP-independent transporter DctP family solute receptor
MLGAPKERALPLIGGLPMPSTFGRHVAVVLGAIAFAGIAAPTASAQGRKVLKFSSTISPNDIRARAMKMFAEAVKSDFKVELYFSATLFKQGTEMVAMQRGNLELSLVAPQDIAKQMPAWSLLTAAYLFRNAAHMNKFFKSDAGKEMIAMAEKRGIHVLTPVYFGTRQLNLKPKKKIMTPKDMKGMKLRMPGGAAWQFLGKALGANPTPMAYTEVYTGLQTGAIDGQDNPLPNDKNMKFYEVTSQIVLTSHLVGYDLLSISSKAWNAMSAAEKAKVQAAADKAIAWSTAQHLKQEAALVAFFRKQGLKVYKPNVAAFRARAQKMYLNSDFAKSWPKGMLERINKM